MKSQITDHRSQIGFTLIELLIAVAVMAILSSLTIANFRATEKNKNLAAAADTVINGVRNAQNRALASEAVAGSTCTINSVPDRSPKNYLVFFGSATSLTLYGVDKCDNAIALETYNYPKDVAVVASGYGVDGFAVNILQIKFTPPFAQTSASSSSTVNAGTFSTFSIAQTTIGIGSKLRTITVDGVSGKVEANDGNPNPPQQNPNPPADNPTPPPSQQPPGIINVSSNVSTSWTISGAGSFSGSGTSGSYTNAASGTYTISAPAVSGYTGPSISPSATQTLNSGGSISFTLNYTAAVGTINVSSNVSTSWTISGPSSFSGSGTSGSYANATLGTYTISPGSVSGHNPATVSPSVTQTLGASQSITFTLNYAAAVGTINVSSNRTTSWTISGPSNFSGSGTSGSYSNARTGNYNITAPAISGYTGPSISPSSSQSLGSGSSISFTLSYTSCSYSVSPTSASPGAAATTQNIAVTAPGGCSWTASSNASWITISSGSSGSGNGTTVLSIAANSGSSRSGTVTVSGQTVTINQAAGNICDTSFPNDSFRVCFFDGMSAPTSATNYLSQQTQIAVPSPVGSWSGFNNDWGSGQVDSSGKDGTVSGVWRGNINFQNGNYVFHTISDDGVELKVGGATVISNWSDHAPEQNNSASISLNGRQEIQLRWYENGGGARIQLWWDHSTQPQPGNGTGLTGSYYSGRDFNTLRTNRTDATVNFDWGGSNPASGVGEDNFSVRWVGDIQARVDGEHVFTIGGDDGVRLWVDNREIASDWQDHGYRETSGPIKSLQAGKRYDIKVEMYENGGDASVKLFWSYQGQDKQIIPQSQLYPGAASSLPAPPPPPPSGGNEICGNGSDDNGNGQINEGCPSNFTQIGGPGAFDVGQTYTGDLGTQRYVWRTWVQVGCNDGESGNFTVTFDDGSSVNHTFSCHDEVYGPAYGFTPRVTRFIRVTMNSGGGGDQHISFNCCGNVGLAADWR